MEHHRALARALDSREQPVPPLLLEECRASLSAALADEAPPPVPRRAAPGARPKSAWKLFVEALSETLAGFGRLRQPVGALALVAIGFFAARFSGTRPAAPVPAEAPSDTVYASVRSVRPDSSGQVRIAFDETRRREVSGSPEDPAIRRLLLAAAREENPSVRVESVDLLKNRAASGEVRDALLNAVAHDPNAGVRLKALEGLQSLGSDAEVRKTLAAALLTDDNPAVRTRAVDLLVEHADDSMVGVLQGLVQQEDNSYVRLKLEKALKGMNASVGTF
jgi:hypothetical protein